MGGVSTGERWRSLGFSRRSKFCSVAGLWGSVFADGGGLPTRWMAFLMRCGCCSGVEGAADFGIRAMAKGMADSASQ